MNDQRLQFFAGKFQKSKTTLFCLGASFCYLLAGQPQKAFAALKDENQEPQRKTQKIGKLVADLTAKCENKSLLDKLKNRPKQAFWLGSSGETDLLGGNDDCPGLPVSGTVYTDSGTTIGANNTNNSVPANCNGSYTTTAGPDKIYQITLPVPGNRTGVCTISVDPTGANWDPSIYLLSVCTNGNSCGAGWGDDNGGSNVTEVVNLATVPAGTYFFFVDSFYGSGALSAGTYNLNFNCPITTAAAASVGGQVTLPNGNGLSRVSVSATDSNGQVRLAVTNPFGYFNFDDLPSGETYVLRVSSKTHQFAEPTQIISVTDNISNIIFTAND